MLEGLGIFLYSDFIFMVGLGLLSLFEKLDKIQNKKHERARRKARCERAKREYERILKGVC